LSTDEEQRVEFGVVGALMISVANGVWAVVGVFFWIPLLVRAVLVSAARIVHGAVTRQPPTYLKAFISRESRFYLAGFWTRQQLQVGAQRKYALKLRRVVGELLWAMIFYLALVRVLDAERFQKLWQPLVELAKRAWEKVADLLTASVAWVPRHLPRLIDSGYPEWIIVLLIILLALVGGIAFGLALRLRRRDSRWIQ